MTEGNRPPSAFEAYWTAYGGTGRLLTSAYLQLSLAAPLLLWPAWQIDDQLSYAPWVDIALQVLPSITSFSLGALAIILSLSSGTFLKVIQQSGRDDSLFMKMIATFFHFILVQFLCIFLAIFCLFWTLVPISFLGFWLFSYSLASGVAAAANLVGLALLKNKAASLEE
jgi:hypothetical protein